MAPGALGSPRAGAEGRRVCEEGVLTTEFIHGHSARRPKEGGARAETGAPRGAKKHEMGGSAMRNVMRGGSPCTLLRYNGLL